MDAKILTYGLTLAVIVVLTWAISSMAIRNNTQNYQYYNSLQQQSATGCGDLTDNGNIQHLSHHPDQYKDCIKQVDPQKFKEAVGQDMDSFLKGRGL